MGACIWCGKDAGFLRRKHRECQQLHDTNLLTIEHLIRDAIIDQSRMDDAISRLPALASKDGSTKMRSTWC